MIWLILAGVLGLVVWLGFRSAKGQGAAEAREKALSQSVEDQKKMDGIKPPGERDTVDSLRDGDF